MVKFARCNALLSLAVGTDGRGCRYVAKGESESDVVKDMGEHLTAVHQVGPGEMAENIMAATKTNRG